MPCTRPVHGYRGLDGKLKQGGPTSHLDTLTVACGKCMGCRIDRTQDWTKRLLAELRMHDEACFVTLTYDEAHLPIDLSLDVRDWQLFADRFRKRFGRFRYYQCGEYGEETDRPHHHAIIFGHDFYSDRQLYRVTPYGKLFTCEKLSRTWGKGHVVLGDVTPETCRYVAGYVQKKLYGDRAYDEYATAWAPDHRTGELLPQMWKRPPFATMSLKPGIGQSYIDKYGDEVYAFDQFVETGKPLRPPKFFDKWLAEKDPERLEHFQHERAERGKRYHEHNTPERLAARDRVGQYRAQQIKRDTI